VLIAGRALARRPPTDPTLAGMCIATRVAPAVLMSRHYDFKKGGVVVCPAAVLLLAPSMKAQPAADIHLRKTGLLP